MINRICIALVPVTSALCLHAQEMPPEPPPNILVIFVDDLGYETVGAYGGLEFETPQIDNMAHEGLMFSRAYTSPVCTPSRVSLHTSLYPTDHHESKVLPIHLGSKDVVDFETMPTFAQLFQANGYETSVTGKWQLAALAYHPDHPRTAGFDSWCVWQIWDGQKNEKTTRYWNPTLNRDGVLLQGQTLKASTMLPNGELLAEDTVVLDARDKFGPDVLDAYVKEKMTQATKEGKPFLILHNMMLPHQPLVPTPVDDEASLKSMIRYLDMMVGGLLEEVDRLGIRDHTYVFFIGDNGTESREPRQTLGGLVQGGKWTLNDGGTHVPFIVWGPDSIEKNSVNSTLVDITDVFPTVCDLAGIQIPEETLIRGYSLAPVITGKAERSPRQWTVMGIADDVAIYDGSWRYIKEGSKEILIDARNLPDEKIIDTETEESRAAKERLSYILSKLSPHSMPENQK